MRNSIFPKREPGSNSWLLSFSWEQRKLGEITNSYSGGTPAVGIKEYYDGTIPFIRSAEINREKTELFISELGLQNSSARYVYPGNILYALYGATSGEVGRSKLKGAINQAILAIIPHKGFDAEFIMQWLRKSKKNIVDTFLQGGQGNLSGAIVKNIELELPEDYEQQKIGIFFQSLDRLITLHQCNYFFNATEMVSRNVEKTFSWEQRKLDSIVERVTRKNTNNESTLPLTISAQYGLVDQITYFNNRVASRDVSNYFLVKNGEFAYNKSSSDGFPFGAIKRLDLYSMGVLSTLYIVFSITDKEKTESDFLTVFFDTDRWHRGVAERAAEGARNHGLLNISADDFLDISLYLPKENKEQQKIGQFFKSLDRLITLHQRECFFSRIRKKLKITSQKTNAWEQRKLGEITNSYSGGTPAVGIKEYYDGTIPFIRSAEINREKTELFISELGLQNSSARYVYPGNILYALYGATSGEVGRSKLKGAINQAILAIIPHKGFDAEFIMQWLRKSKKNIVDTFLQGGQGNLSGAIVKNIELELPEDYEQQKIGIFFQSLDRLITLHQRERLFLILEEILC